MNLGPLEVMVHKDAVGYNVETAASIRTSTFKQVYVEFWKNKGISTPEQDA